ncbi:MAG: 30S ribosomal protein S18 [Chloroflexi bacterium]|nr:30S ribosomal protein S18 [Chloroflexota bacterium]
MPRTGRPRSRGEDRGRGYQFKRKVCSFCVDKVKAIDYKEPFKLRRYISERGKIEPRRRRGTCAKHQRVLALAVKRARFLALLPYVPEHIYKAGGAGMSEQPVASSAAGPTTGPVTG